MIFGPELAKRPHERTCGTRLSSRKSPQPSGGACDVEEQPSAGGGCRLLRPFGRKFKIQDSEFKITDRAATCGEHTRADLRDASCGPPLGGGSGPLGLFKAEIQDSKFKIKKGAFDSSSGRSLRRSRTFGNELRASAAPRLRPADLCEVEPDDNPAAERWACDAKEQPSARRRLRAAAASCEAANS